MILGYDFIEERLFAFKDYANLSENGVKYLRKKRSQIAKDLKRNHDLNKWYRDADMRQIIEESGGDINKVIDGFNRKTVNLGGRSSILSNMANPLVFEKRTNQILEDARHSAKKAADIARSLS